MFTSKTYSYINRHERDVYGYLRQVAKERKEVFKGVTENLNKEGEEVYIESQGHLFKVKVKKNGGKVGGGIRGTIQGFSAASRKRLLESFARIDMNLMTQLSPLVMITLTYPLEWPDMETSKKHLELFILKMKRRFRKNVCGYWRLEYQKRGAPHYHILVWNLPFWHYEEVNRVWAEIIGGVARTEIKICANFKQSLYYAAKYIGKVEYDINEDNKDLDCRVFDDYMEGDGVRADALTARGGTPARGGGSPGRRGRRLFSCQCHIFRQVGIRGRGERAN